MNGELYKKHYLSTLCNRNEDDQDLQANKKIQSHTLVLTNDNSNEIRKASDLFQNSDWINAVKKCFNSNDNLLVREVNESLNKQVDELIKNSSY